MTAPIHEPILSPVTVGRGDQLGFLARMLDAARSGSGQTVLVSGEAGVGKSRLVAETRRRARELGFRALEGWCFEADRSLPYAPISDLLRNHLCTAPPEPAAQRLGRAAAEFARVLPELADELPGADALPPVEPDRERQRLYHAVAQLLGELTARGPLLVVLEDLHWADELSLQLLVDMARRAAAQRVLLLLTYRREEVSTALGQLLADLDRRRLASEIVLSPLDAAGVEEMVRAILGLDRAPRSEFLADLYALTEGNPFFVEEVLGSLVREGAAFHLRTGWDRSPPAGLEIPRSVHESVRRRSAGLTPGARDLLVVAAVAGRRFDFRLPQEVLGRDEEELLAAIRELISAQLVVETSADQFAFRHALTREAVESGLLSRERSALHRRVGEGLERLHAQTGELEAHISDLARHFQEAAEWEKVLDYAARAGRRAQALYAPHVAAEQLTRALDAAARLGREADPELLRSRGLAYDTLGEFEPALADLEAALALVRQRGDAEAEWQGLVDLGQLWASRDYVRTGEHLQAALGLARATGDRALIARSLNWVGNWHLNVAEYDEGLRCHREALEIFEEMGDRRGLAETYDLLGLAANMADDLVEGAAHCRAAIALFRDLDDRRRLASSLSMLADTLGDRLFHEAAAQPGAGPGEAVAHAEEALRLAREAGWRSGEAYALVVVGCCHGSLGDYGPGLRAAREALAVAEEIGHVEWSAGARCTLGALHRDLLDTDAARRHLEEAARRATEAASTHWVGCAAGFLASACLLAGDADAAKAALDAAGHTRQPATSTADRLRRVALGELALLRGDAEESLAIAEELLGPGGGAVPRLLKLRGEALAALGRRDAAEAQLLEAQRAAQADGVRPVLWRVDVALGRLYREMRRPGAAEQAFASARESVARLAAGIPDDDLRARFLDAAAGLIPAARHPTERQAAKQAYGGLTGREREVAALIASGKANRDIARALVLSDRTVEGHVANILAKLSFTTRAQIAAWAVERGLAGTGR